MAERITDGLPAESRVEPAAAPLPPVEPESTATVITRRRFVEAVVVLVVVVLVVGYFVQPLTWVHEAANRLMRLHRFKEVGQGLHQMAQVHEDRVSPAVGRFPDECGPRSTLWFHLLPHVENDGIHRRLLLDHPDGEIREEPPVWIKEYHFLGDPNNPDINSRISFTSNHAVFGDRTSGFAGRLKGKGLANTVVVVSRSSVHAGGVSTWGNTAPFNTYISGTNATIYRLTGSDDRSAPQDAAHCFFGDTTEVLLADGAGRAVRFGSPGFALALDPNDFRLMPTDW